MVDNALEAAQWRKMLEMERSVSQIRAVVIALNVVVYFVLMGRDTPRAPLALAVIAVAVPYAIWSYLARPYERYPLLRFGAFTLSGDVLLITLWVLGTGGIHSEFWVIYFISVVSVAMRYDLRQTMFAAAGEAVVYGVTAAADGLRGPSLAVRPAYILICGFAAGLLARMERISREERLTAQQLADENAALLSREREAVERLREVDRLKTEFVAKAAHELRTPLTTLSGLAMTLAWRRADLSEQDLSRAFEAMGRQGERARYLIENLLDLSRIEAGAQELALEPVNLADVVRAAVEVAPPPAEVELVIDVPASILAMAESARLQQVLANLLTNAYRYGGRHVRIAAEAGDRTVLTVQDDGPGVPDVDVPLIFDPFSRGSNVNGTNGSGLGLTISSRLVEAFGGELGYEHASGGGSAFRLSLKRA